MTGSQLLDQIETGLALRAEIAQMKNEGAHRWLVRDVERSLEDLETSLDRTLREIVEYHCDDRYVRESPW